MYIPFYSHCGNSIYSTRLGPAVLYLSLSIPIAGIRMNPEFYRIRVTWRDAFYSHCGNSLAECIPYAIQHGALSIPIAGIQAIHNCTYNISTQNGFLFPLREFILKLIKPRCYTIYTFLFPLREFGGANLVDSLVDLVLPFYSHCGNSLFPSPTIVPPPKVFFLFPLREFWPTDVLASTAVLALSIPIAGIPTSHSKFR